MALSQYKLIWNYKTGMVQNEPWVVRCDKCHLEIQNTWDHSILCPDFEEEPLKKFLEDGLSDKGHTRRDAPTST